MWKQPSHYWTASWIKQMLLILVSWLTMPWNCSRSTTLRSRYSALSHSSTKLQETFVTGSIGHSRSLTVEDLDVRLLHIRGELWKTSVCRHESCCCVDADRLAVQLAMMWQQQWQLESVEDIATKLTAAQPVVGSMFDQVQQLLRLLLTIPCSSAEAERSFLSVRLLKTYLCNSMSQQQLNHLAVLRVHKDKLHIVNQRVVRQLRQS